MRNDPFNNLLRCTMDFKLLSIESILALDGVLLAIEA